MDKHGQHYKTGGTSIISNLERDALGQGNEILTNDRMLYPLIFNDTLGAICVYKLRRSKPFTELQQNIFLSLSEEISVGLKMFSLYWDEQKAMVNYIKSLAAILGQYVPTSHMNLKCSQRLIKAVAKRMRLTSAETTSLEQASLLHDAGKIQVPSALLQQQRPLTDEEYKIIQRHPEEGVELIKDLDTLKPVLPIILHHHERFDGTGYPAKLKGDQIPIGARILAVIDAFDAMYYGRPYRERMSLPEIEAELQKQTGNQFDPQVVKVFLCVIQRKDIRRLIQTTVPERIV
jgi:response regulator RpfG family c-di-GMP phosphodiesterase